MNQGQWLDEMVDWLESFAWKWFCSLTFRPGLSEAQARWRLQRWIEELCEELGTSDFQWIGIPELGRTGADLHFHLLIAGLCEWHAPERLAWMRRWWKFAGDARIDVYKPGVGGVRYVLKNVGPDDMDKIEFHLASRTRLESEFGAK